MTVTNKMRNRTEAELLGAKPVERNVLVVERLIIQQDLKKEKKNVLPSGKPVGSVESPIIFNPNVGRKQPQSMKWQMRTKMVKLAILVVRPFSLELRVKSTL